MPIEEVVVVGIICDVVGVGCCACEMAACGGRVVIDDGGGLIVEASLLAVASLVSWVHLNYLLESLLYIHLKCIIHDIS